MKKRTVTCTNSIFLLIWLYQNMFVFLPSSSNIYGNKGMTRKGEGLCFCVYMMPTMVRGF